MAAASAAEIAGPLLEWYREARRDLPWRRDPEPWRVLVAETMLQQTRVATVLPRYEKFLARFPSPSSMARATEDEVLALWSGLGYYRRARNLHSASRAIVEHHDGAVPGDPEALRSLPGVGDYTAGAVLSIAFGLPEPIVDGNVIRVMSRVFLVRGDAKRGDARRRIRALAEELVHAGRPDLVNQAVMELGALVCVRMPPRCEACPLEGLCGAREAGAEEELPERPEPRAAVEVVLAVGLAREGGRVLLVRAPEGGLLAGIWGPPFARVPVGAEPARILEDFCRSDLGLDLVSGDPLGAFRHAITHHRIRALCFGARIRGVADGSEAVWVPESALPDYGLSSLARKSLRLQFS